MFFGHVRGAFSGATGDHVGLFEQAGGGTLFLDEVDSFPLQLQAKLLRVLESRELQRIGSSVDRPVDVRIIAASATDLRARVTEGQFRADLYYRLGQLEVLLPPLRERPEDVAPMAQRFLDELAAETGRRPTLSRPALDALCGHAWPGNARELRHALRAAALLAGGGTILPSHLPRALRPEAGDVARSGTLRDLEREHIQRTMERTGGNLSLAARLLGIDRGTLARKLRILRDKRSDS
jgi:DNA-binding NtrC family response regulator